MRLFDFILQNMEPILKEWENFARSKQPPEGDMDVGELRDDAEEMLRFMAQDMQTPQSERERSEKSRGNKPKQAGNSVAETHAIGRLASGFSINLLAAEYRALRASVLQLWLRERHDLEPGMVEDLIRFNEAIDQMLAESLSRYSEIIQMDQNVFLGILGHDLRSPLQAISHSAEYLMHANAMENMESMASELGARMQGSVNRMAGMIDNLLDFTQSRISGGIKIHPAETDLSGVARQIIGEFRLNNPGRLIHNNIEGDCKGYWDATRIAQIYQNLISNALQYGDREQAVSVTTRSLPDEVVIQVHNHGTPIPQEEQARLFDLLHRRAHSEGAEISRKNLGLGLFIVREIVSAHCGTITVESTEAKGTYFVVRLPKDLEAACQSAKSHKSRVARATNFSFPDNSADNRLH
jgi:signal transduction histidine kinase